MAMFTPPNYNHPLVLMFGGRLAPTNGNKDTNETWVMELLGNTGHPSRDNLQAKWYLVPIPDDDSHKCATKRAKPSARTGHVMSNLGKDSVVLFGGYDSSKKSVLGDTWIFVGISPSKSKWHYIEPTSARSMASEIISNAYTHRSAVSPLWHPSIQKPQCCLSGTIETNWVTNASSLLRTRSLGT